jgi:hypothetical protein
MTITVILGNNICQRQYFMENLWSISVWWLALWKGWYQNQWFCWKHNSLHLSWYGNCYFRNFCQWQIDWRRGSSNKKVQVVSFIKCLQLFLEKKFFYIKFVQPVGLLQSLRNIVWVLYLSCWTANKVIKCFKWVLE